MSINIDKQKLREQLRLTEYEDHFFEKDFDYLIRKGVTKFETLDGSSGERVKTSADLTDVGALLQDTLDYGAVNIAVKVKGDFPIGQKVVMNQHEQGITSDWSCKWKRKTGFTDIMLEFQKRNFISGLYLDLNNSVVHALKQTGGYNARIRDCYFYHGSGLHLAGDGVFGKMLYFEGGDGAGVVPLKLEGVWQNLEGIFGSGGHPTIHQSYCSDSYYSNVNIEDPCDNALETFACHRIVWDVLKVAQPHHTQTSGMPFVLVEGGDDVTFDNLGLHEPTGSGVDGFAGEQITINNPMIRDCGYGGAYGIGIYLRADVKDWIIHGGSIKGCKQYAFYETAGCDYNTVLGVNGRGNLDPSYDFYAVGTNTKVEHCQGRVYHA